MDKITQIVPEKHIPSFLEEIIEITSGRTKWMDLGRALKVSRNYLKDIKQNGFDDETSNRMMLKKWIEENKEASWDLLASALIFIGDRDLATKIYSKHSKTLFDCIIFLGI